MKLIKTIVDFFTIRPEIQRIIQEAVFMTKFVEKEAQQTKESERTK